MEKDATKIFRKGLLEKKEDHFKSITKKKMSSKKLDNVLWKSGVLKKDRGNNLKKNDILESRRRRKGDLLEKMIEKAF